MAALQEGSEGVELKDGIDLRVSATMRRTSLSSEMRLQVIVDIDDTVKSSGGVTIAGVPIGGVDTQYKRGTFYPGVFRFVCALSKHGVEGEEHPLKVAVLTARAEELKFALQLKATDPVCRGFAEAGQKEGFAEWGIGDVMYGSVREWVLQDLKGWRKFENFKLLRQLLARSLNSSQEDGSLNNGGVLKPAAHLPRSEPERYVFVGDTGELDKECGMRMLTDRDTSPRVLAVFLHVVSFRPNPVVPRDHFINGKPVCYFRTYAGAATKALQHGLVTGEEAKAVILQACADLRDQHHSSGLDKHAGKADGAGASETPGKQSVAKQTGGYTNGYTAQKKANVDPQFVSKWTELQRDIEVAMAAFPRELGGLDPALLQPKNLR